MTTISLTVLTVPTLENCKVLCTNCHYVKTTTVDRPLMQKADNIKAKTFGFKAEGQPMPGARNSKFKKKMNGQVVLR